MRVKFTDVFLDETKLGHKIQASEYQSFGNYPIIDQGQSQIAGYTNVEDGFFSDVPAIIFGDHTRVIKYVDTPFFLGADGVKVLKSKLLDVDYKYLFYCLQNVKIPDTGYNRHFKWLKVAEIPLPPLDEQRRIAAVLDKVSDLIAKRREQLDKLDELVKARFVEMFGNFVYERDRWNICVIGDVADTIDPHPSHRTPPVVPDGIPYVGITECNYVTRRIDFEKARKVGQYVLQEHIKRYTLNDGDFIIGKIGTIGKPFFIPAERTYTLSANTVLIKPIKGKVVPQYLYAVFQSEYMDCIIDTEKKSTSQPAFGIQKVRRIEIPLPPPELQQQFAAFVEQTDKSKLTIQRSLDTMETLKKALMQECFG